MPFAEPGPEGIQGAWSCQMGWGKEEGHLPRRQRKVRTRGGCILGEVSRGQRSLLKWEEMSRDL
jgi:hypothetical protein